MELHSLTNDVNGILRNDKLLVCGMLAIYSICVLGMIGLVFLGVDYRNREISTNATATAVVSSTQQAQATGTSIAIATEQAQYKLVDRFDKDTDTWLTGNENNDYFMGSIHIIGGVYSWDIQEIKQPFFYWADYAKGSRVRNVDTYIDTKFTESTQTYTCSGIIVRKAASGIDDGAYIFSICNNSDFNVWFYKNDEWETISGHTFEPIIRPVDWNRLAVSVREDQFTFQINGRMVYTFTDDRQKTGNIALYIEADDAPISVWFDNFGYQPR